ncbi:MAG TPA: tetratricopeptide repeat protein [Deltaproteobacteria bacterium]|nr:tetratricopeptide repeat protein [Deltaproteobacteria bacterium]
MYVGLRFLKILFLCAMFLMSCNASAPLSPPDMREIMEEGNEYLKSGNYENAIASYDAVVSSLEGTDDPNLSAAYYNRGLVLLETRKYAQAIYDFSSVIETNPQDADAYFNRGYAYAREAMLERAIEDYSTSLALNPNNTDIHYALAMIHFKRNDYEKTAVVLSEAIILKPDFGKAYNGRGQAYLKSGLHNAALIDFRRACELGEKSGCIMMEITSQAHKNMDK